MREIRPARHAQRRAAAAAPARPRPASGSTPAARPSTAASTSATRGRSSSSACSSASSSTRATRSRSSINVTDVNDKIYDAARAQGRPSAELAARDDRALPRRHRRARARPPRPRAARLARRSGRSSTTSQTLIDARPRLRGRRRRLLPRALGPRLRQPLAPRASTTWTRARASRAPSARRTRSTSRCGRRTSRARTRAWDAPWGRGPARAGTSSARRWPRSCSASASTSTAAARTSSSPTTRTRPPRRARRAAHELARIWMHNGMIQFTGEKMAKSVGNIAPLHEVLDAATGRDAVVMYLVSGHYRQPLAFSRGGARAGASASVDADPRGRAAARAAGAVARRTCAPLRDALLRRARRRLQHARGARRAVRVDPRGQPPRRRGVGRRATCARCSACSASRALLDAATRRRPREVRELAEQREQARAAARLRRRRRAARRDRRARLGGPRRRAAASSCCRW